MRYTFVDNYTARKLAPALLTVVSSLVVGLALAWQISLSSGLILPNSYKASNPLNNTSLYIDPESNAAQTAHAWLGTRPSDAAPLQKLAAEPTATWLTSDNALDESLAHYISTANSAAKTPLLVAYDIPLRDCGLYSSGGARNHKDYQAFIDTLTRIIGTSKAIIVVEPDALASVDSKDASGKACLTNSQINQRYQSLRYAVQQLSKLSGTIVYIDAGNSAWGDSPGKTAARLRKAGIAMANGFSLNVSNFQTTSTTLRYGYNIAEALNGKHFIIDTSRNGLGPYTQGNSPQTWCNPPGRSLGHYPTAQTKQPLVDAYLYVKNPGESDGADADPSKCHGGPQAGTWWPDYALGLAKRWPAALQPPLSTR